MTSISVHKVASKGIAFGQCFLVKEPKLDPDSYLISPQEGEKELQLFLHSLTQVKADLSHLAQHSPIFAAHLEMVDDPTLLSSVKEKIIQNHNAQQALHLTSNEICSTLERLEDEYLRERANDMKDISKRLMCHLKGISLNPFSNIQKNVIIVADDLTPSDTAHMNFDFVKGLITAKGGVTSHVSIIARQLKLPAMVGVTHILSQVSSDDFLILDGLSQQIFIGPDDNTTATLEKKAREYLDYCSQLERLLTLPTETMDGHKVELFANVGNAKDVKIAMERGAEGVGLFRTELLYMDSDHFPTEEEQFLQYKTALEYTKTPMIVRTLDIGGDKSLPYFKFPREENPYLGYRAIRMCFDKKEEVFKPQLKALLRASVFGDLRIMYPMIISVEEFLAANTILEECKEELQKNNIPFSDNISTGIMIETPAAVLMSEHLAKVVDFFSIGTNDLTQYLLCVDRGNETIEHLYDTFHPAVLNAIATVIENGHKYKKKVGVCGEFAANPQAIPLLLGMGLDEFSMASSSLLESRHLIRSLQLHQCEEVKDNILQQTTSNDVHSCLQEYLTK